MRIVSLLAAGLARLGELRAALLATLLLLLALTALATLLLAHAG